MQAEQIQVDKNEKKKSELLDDELELLPVYTRDTSRTRIPSEAVDHLSALKRIDKALSKFKFSKNEVRVYLYLARFGAHKAQSIAESLDVHRTEAYKILRRLESQGLISRVMERPMKFVAVPFETVLSQLIEERRQRVHQLEKKKTELLKIWASLPEPDNVQETKETFQVLEGKRHISVRLNELLEKRERVSNWYNHRLAEIEGIETPFLAPYTTRASWFVYVIRVDRRINRELLSSELRKRGIPSRPYFIPIHLQPYMVEHYGYRLGDFPITEDIGNRSLALPFSSTMEEHDVEYVCSALKKIISVS